MAEIVLEAGEVNVIAIGNAKCRSGETEGLRVNKHPFQHVNFDSHIILCMIA